MQSNNLLNILAEQNRQTPLPELMRPKTLDDYLGQEEVLGTGTPLRNLIETRQLISLIFWGLPGVGKTTLARIIAKGSGAEFIELSAVNSGIKELREAVAQAEETLKLSGAATVVFIDEIHRYSKTQQDAILPFVENGTIILMGATTENPSFQVIPALLSRVLIVRLNALNREHMKTLIKRGVVFLGKTRQKLTISLEAMGFIADYANGDGRSALNLLETAFKCAPIWKDEKGDDTRLIEMTLLEQLAQQNRLNYDRQGDEHFDHASAYQKSMRGGDADAAIYWLGKMLAGGEDPRFIARRLMITASEDVGLADPKAFQLAVAAAQAVERLGLPEGRIPLAMATIYTANAPKSNAAISAIDAAMADITRHGHNYPVPTHLRDPHYSGAQAYGHGVGYVYTHDHPETPQVFLPAELAEKRYVTPQPGQRVGKARSQTSVDS
ncbi:replication-associated recombination protein A [Vampirovibrio chlorellavorus]|uniref:replication-associated recombination protein A n=1 Tax=Vampirovibrio chlorellavorus TaxID=758823 RepID=UPI0026F195AA|nr:replication-associated recombination protein A [Vampirovibrio chlorellavorus]